MHHDVYGWAPIVGDQGCLGDSGRLRTRSMRVLHTRLNERVRYKGKEKPTLRSALYDYCFGCCPKALNPPAVHFAVLMQVRNATISLDFPAEI